MKVVGGVCNKSLGGLFVNLELMRLALEFRVVGYIVSHDLYLKASIN